MLQTARKPGLRAALASLMMDAFDDLATVDAVPTFETQPDFQTWTRQGQESFLALRRNAWRMPDRVPLLRWLEGFEAMKSVRSVITTDPELNARVDCCVGVEFWSHGRNLITLLLRYLLDPMVRDTRSYQYNEATFDQHYQALEAGLLAERVRLVQFVPLNAFTATAGVGTIPLRDGVVLQEMTDLQISAAIGYHAVPGQFAGGTNSVHVSRFHQWALTLEQAYPIVSDRAGMPPQPTAPSYDELINTAERLVAALRIVCGGSGVATRPIHIQHEDDFPLVNGSSAVRTAVPGADYDRPTILDRGQIESLQRLHGYLGQPAVATDRNLQKAIRRLVIAGSQADPAERLTDLIVAAEVLLLKRYGYKGQRKGSELARRAANLLTADTVLAVEPFQVEEFMARAYRVRNAEMHGDDPVALELRQLDGSRARGLGAVAEGVDQTMRRAIYRVVEDIAVQSAMSE